MLRVSLKYRYRNIENHPVINIEGNNKYDKKRSAKIAKKISQKYGSKR
jgi:hypothetical protein